MQQGTPKKLMHHDYIMSATSTVVVGQRNDKNKSVTSAVTFEVLI